MGMARTMSGMVGLNYDAIYHTGLHVFGKEYFFGGGVGSGSGISSMPPRDFERSFNIRPIETIRMGTTTKTQSEFEAWIRQITPQWACNTYVLLSLTISFLLHLHRVLIQVLTTSTQLQSFHRYGTSVSHGKDVAFKNLESSERVPSHTFGTTDRTHDRSLFG